MITMDDAQYAYSEYGEPLIKFMWKVKAMPEFGGRKLNPARIHSASIPLEELGVNVKITAASNVSMPDMSTVSSITLTVREDSKGRVLDYFATWQEHIQNPHTGGYYKPSNYKRDLEFELYNTKGEVAIRVLVRQAWPSSIGELGLDQDSGFHEYSITLPIDAVIPLPSKDI